MEKKKKEREVQIVSVKQAWIEEENTHFTRMGS